MGDLVGGLFGGDEPVEAVSNFKPVGFSGGGISSSYNANNNTVSVSSNANRKGLFKSLSDKFSEQSGEYDNLLGLVKPGFGQLTASRVGAIRDAARQSVGNLSDTLSRRRVFGSSFGQDAISRANAEFAKQEADVKARSYLEELDVTTQLIEKKYNSAVSSVQAIIDNLNIEANVGTQIASQATSALSATAQAQGQLASQRNEQGLDVAGSLLGLGLGFI